MLPLSPLRFSTIGKPILRTFEIFRFFDNSFGARAKARATAMASAMARARRTRAKDRDGWTDGQTDGAIYLANCATPKNSPTWKYTSILVRGVARLSARTATACRGQKPEYWFACSCLCCSSASLSCFFVPSFSLISA